MSNTADAPAPVAKTGARQPLADPADIEVIAPNFKRRLSGVTTTVMRVLPEQAKTVRVATAGVPLATAVPRVAWSRIAALWRPPARRRFRIWHARRNLEMAAGVLLRDVLRMPLRLVFTSAAQRDHTRWTKFLIRRMDGLIAASRRAAGYLKRPATVIPHGIDTDALRPPASRRAAKAALGYPPDAILVGCFGRIRHQKGTDVFVEAMVAVLPAHPSACAVVLGRATAEHVRFLEDLKRRVDAAGLADRIRFLGEVPDTGPWYEALDVFVAPQRWEGFGVTPLEAGAHAVPVVATTAGAFPDIVSDRVSGRLVPPDDLPALTEAVGELLVDAGLRRRLGSAARERIAAEFSLAREAAAINAVYERLWTEAR
jgi:mannosyltransferase